jgi:hypothetical protein
MSTISSFLKGATKSKTIRMFVSNILSNNRYLICDEKSHCELEVTGQIKIGQGRFIKITFCEAKEDKLFTTDKSEVYNCSPFKCLTVSEDVKINYSKDSDETENQTLEKSDSLKEADLISGKVSNWSQYYFNVKNNNKN